MLPLDKGDYLETNSEFGNRDFIIGFDTALLFIVAYDMLYHPNLKYPEMT